MVKKPCRRPTSTASLRKGCASPISTQATPFADHPALWTGIGPRHNPVRGNVNYSFRGDEPTVAKLLQLQGYATGGVGKWAMANADGGHPNDNGFDFWMGYLDQSAAHNYYPLHLWRNREKVSLPGNTLHPSTPVTMGRVAKERVTYAHDVMTAEALSFIRRNANHPFLLHVHWTLPHANNEGGRFQGDGMEVPDWGEFAKRDWPAPEKGFAAMISRMDRDVGRIMELLRELGLENNTIVLFTSDNGPHSEGEHRHEFFDSNGSLRGFKRDLYEGGIRVPLIARWPGHIAAGTSTGHVAAFWDYLPTACELAGAGAPPAAEGVSFLPTLLGRSQPAAGPLHWILDLEPGRRSAVRSGNWKAVKPSENAAWELYDLSTDLGETTDLAKAKPDVLASLIADF
jgi:arylsulfatase A-like enzyme